MSNNNNIHRDLKIKTVAKEIKVCSLRHSKRLEAHQSVEIRPLPQHQQRLKMTKHIDMKSIDIWNLVDLLGEPLLTIYCIETILLVKLYII